MIATPAGPQFLDAGRRRPAGGPPESACQTGGYTVESRWGRPVAARSECPRIVGGALLTMLADTMIPEAYRQARQVAGLWLVLGFALAFALSALYAAA